MKRPTQMQMYIQSSRDSIIRMAGEAAGKAYEEGNDELGDHYMDVMADIPSAPGPETYPKKTSI